MSMSQLKKIDEYVKKLFESASSKTDETRQAASDLGDALTTNIPENEIDYAYSSLFNPDTGIIRFLKKCGGQKDASVGSAVADLLKIIAQFIKKRKSTAFQPYAVDLKNQCLEISKQGNGNSRAAAVDVLVIMLDKRNIVDTTELDIRNIYTRYSNEYTLPKTKLPSTVKAKIIELLGLIARYYPEVVGPMGFRNLKRWCFDNMEHQIKLSLKDAEGQTITGSLYCLGNVMYCDNDEVIKPQTEESDRLFNIILTVLTTYKNATRYDPPLAALTVFKDHTDFFSNMLLSQWKEMFDCLHFWASHHNKDCYKLGLQGYEQYLRQVSNILYHNIGGKHEKIIFRHIMSEFNMNLKTADNLENYYHVSVSIRGVGYFSKVCAKMMTREDMDELRNNLVKISDWFYSDINAGQRDYAHHLPAFIKAYTLFAAELDPIPADLMETIHRMCNIFIMGYTDISGYHRRNGVYNIQALFAMLYEKSEGLFRNFLNDFFERALICTCTEIQTPYNEDRPAYNDFLYFWKAILSKSRDNGVRVKVEGTQRDNNDEAEDEEAEENMYMLCRDAPVVEPINLSDTLYDSFLLAVLKLTKTFNLKLKNVSEDIKDAEDAKETSETEESEIGLSAVSDSLQPVNQKDFVFFQNLVEFWCLILKEIDNKRLTDWVYIVGTAVIDQSVLNPLVSGFYRMMSEIMTVCEKRQLFLGCKEYYSQTKYETNEEKAMPEEYTTYFVFRDYLKDVWHRLQQFTDELLASCLRLILAYPVAFFDLAELITPLEKALKLGITYHPLATISMNSLDKLLDPSLGYDINSEFLSRILPCINEYLLVGVISVSNEGPVEKKKAYKIPTAAQRRYESVHIKVTSDQLGVAKSDYSSLPELQLRMMQFLGRLGGKNKELLLQGNESIQSNDMLAWDPIKRLKLRIPFRNSKVDVYLDEFLPRICELAESSPDRQVKVAACELLHGLALFMIGNAAFQARDSKATTESDFHKLYLRIFPVMLRLCIDPDQAARDMFRLLYTQIIHWLTNNAHSENPETIALLSTCLDAACNTDAGLRDYAAECIQEFVKWSIKQTARSTDNAMNIKSLLKRLFNLMTNPSPTKRFGASLVFNRIYRIFREEIVLVNEYTLEILGQLFDSLKMAEMDHPSVGTRDQIVEAISHIKRILRVKADSFMGQNPTRRRFMSTESVHDFATLVKWTFEQSGSPQRAYAKVCMNFFAEFVVRIKGIKSAKDWLSKETATNHNFYIDVFEADQLHEPSSMDDDEKILDIYTNWIKRLNSALNGYIWLIERNVLDPLELLHNTNSMFLIAVSYFIKNTPSDVLEEKLDQSVVEKNRILSTYAHISVRLIYFFDLIFKSSGNGGQCYNYMNRVSQDILYHTNFTNSIARTLLLPKHTSETILSDQGNAVTNSGANRMFTIANDFIVTMNDKSSSEFMESMAASVSKTIHDENTSTLITSESSLERSSLIKMIQTIDGIKLLQSLGSLESVCQELHKLKNSHPDSADEYCLQLFNQYLRLCQSTQDPLWIQLLGGSINICFSQKGFPERHASELLGLSGPLEHLTNSEKLDVFQKHREYIYECMAYHFDAFSPVLASHIEHPVLRNYITMFLEYLKQNRLSQRKLVFKFSDYLVEDPTFLDALVTHSKTDDQLLDLIVSLKLLFGADPSIMSRSKKKETFSILWKAFMNLLDKNHAFVVKNSALDLLPVYIRLGEENTKLIINKLNESIVQNFPPGTEDLKKGTTLYNEYISYLDKLLETMATFKSAEIFNLLIGVFVQEEHHIHEETIRKKVEEFTNGLGLIHFMAVAGYCFKEFKNEHNNILQRHNLAELIISLSVGVDDRAVVTFYEKNIVYMMDVIQRDSASNPNKQVQDWSEKSDCLRLVQGLYDRLPKVLVDQTNSINETWMKSEKNTTRKKIEVVIIGALVALRKTPILPAGLSNDNGRRDAQFLYNKSVYNTAVSIAVRVGEKPSVFQLFFFTDKVYTTYLWEYIIDTSQKIELSIELDKPLVKTRLDDLRAMSGYSAGTNEQNISYMASIALTGSSFTQSSLSETVLEENQNESDRTSSATTNMFAQDVDTEMTEPSDVVEVEVDEGQEFEIDVLNSNSFMKPLTELIERMHKEIFPPPAEPIDMPAWMNEMLKAFKANDDELVIQLHIAKLITNYPFAFAKYASYWMLPLMELATKGAQYSLKDKWGSPIASINYLVQDLCIILIVWGKETDIPSPRSMETRRILFEFLQFLIKNSYHEEQRILRSNIQIIKGVFENWGKHIPVPTRAIYEQFTHKGEKSLKNAIGLQVVSIVFLNGANPYDDNELSDIFDLPEVTFYTDMAANVNYKERKKKDISADAAELMGMSMHYMREHRNSNLESIKGVYSNLLIGLSRSTKHSSLHFLKCMNRLYLHDLELARELSSIITQNLNQYANSEKLLAMTYISFCWTEDDMIYYILQQAGIERMISNRDEKMQIASLNVLNKIFEVLKEDEIRWIIKRISRAFEDHSNQECRRLYYAFLKKAFKTNVVVDNGLKMEIKAHLLKGLIDKDKTISQDLFDFIEHEFQVNDDVNLTLQKITSDMYMPVTEDIYLLYATCMVLNNTKKSYDFDKPIFDKPLPNARFDAEYQHINTSWQNTSSMMPLFRATQPKTLNAEDLELELRRTQSLLEFSATQGTSKSLLATFNPESEEAATEQSLDDMSLLQEPKTPIKKIVKKENPYSPKRFIATPPGATNRFHSDRNERLEKKVRNLKNTHQEVSEKKVTLSRAYRVGELPDVQINFKDLLLPLEVLASADYNISRLLYSSLVVGIIKANDTDAIQFQEKIMKNVEDNVVASSLNFPPTIGSFLRIFFELNVTRLPEHLIRKASSSSFNHHIGIALLEKQLEIAAVPATAGKRRYNDHGASEETVMSKEDMQKRKNRWIDLAMLYKEIDETEIFRNIYQTNVAAEDLTKDAINAEIRGDYVSAFNNFKRARIDHPDETYENALWNEQMLFCYTQLTQWKDIGDEITAVLENQPNRIWEPELKDLYFNYFVRSYSKFDMMDDDQNPIIQFFDEAANNESHKEYLFKNYACDWSAVSITRKQYDFGSQLIKNSYDSLLASWTTLHPLAHTSRLAKLGQLERTVEIEDYLKLVKKIKQSVATSDQVENFFNTLSLSYPDEKADSIDVWDDIIDTRFAFINDLKSQNLQVVENELPSFDRYQIKFLVAMSEAALKQNNLKVIQKISQKLETLNANYEAQLGYLQLFQKRTLALENDDPDKHRFVSGTLIRSLGYDPPLHSQVQDSFKSKLVLAHSFDIVKQQIIINPNLFDEITKSNKIKKAFKNTPEVINNADVLVNYLESTAFDRLMEAGELVDKEDALYIEYLWKLGNYCDKSLHTLQDSTSTLQADIDPIQYSKMVIKCYFEAMDRGHKEATENFPRLLELIELYPESGPIFKQYSLELDASWRYIRWIPQLVSFIETPIATYILPSIYRIAENYPRALYYPFHMSFEHYELKKDTITEENRRAIEKIGEMIRSEIMHTFTFELKRLTDSDLLVKDFCDFIQSLIYDGKKPESFIHKVYAEFSSLVLNPYGEKNGQLAKDFCAKHGTTLNKLFGKNGCNLNKLTPEQLKNLRELWTKTMEDKQPQKQKNYDKLKSYSPWLANFKCSDYPEQPLEIPGQYDGMSKPYPEFHARVAGFDSHILCMRSMRKPKRVTILGSDEKEHFFLVKGGEDLRLDQRIQQLFNVMNDMLKKNSFCSRQNVEIPTYKVVPMSSSLGIIEWVDKTKPLKDCIETEMNRLARLRMPEKYKEWIDRHAPRKPPKIAYHKSYADSRENIEKAFDSITEMIPNTALRDFVLKQASSPEAFLFLRKDFAYSLACISIFGYILGIGDRHLENSLLDMKSGRMIPIDFGYAFGSATELLQITEAVPFRLTRQLVGVLEPLGVSGILEDTMTNVLQAIQDGKDLLLNIMNVFIKDPLLDWQKAANRLAKIQRQEGRDTPSGSESSAEAGQTDWYPQKKLDIVKRKLNGDNPAYIMSTEIENGHGRQQFAIDLISLVKGDLNRDIRAEVGETCKDANEQVRCLINLATDKSVLGVTWAGWQSYL